MNTFGDLAQHYMKYELGDVADDQKSPTTVERYLQILTNRSGIRLRRGHRDGSGDNASWNWGCEGESTDREIQALRRQVMKNTFCLLLLSNGVPMILVGDEMGRTQHGNNNTYCHDSDLTWMDWTLVQQNAELLRFVKKLLMFRKAHAALRARAFLRHADYRGLERPISAFTVQGPFARHLQG